MGELREPGAEVGRHVLALPAPLNKDGEVLGLGSHRDGNRAVVIKTPPPLQDLLGALLVLPEVGL